MQQYSHNYTLVQKAAESLRSAQRLHANECYSAVLDRINEASQLLQQYLAQDNMLPDNDAKNGWVRYMEAQSELESPRRRVEGNAKHPATDGLPVGTTSQSTRRVERHGQIDSRFLTQVTDDADPTNPLYGKVVVMSGTFEQIHMERDQVAAAIQRLGAKLNRSVSSTIQVFVMGNKVGPSKLAEVEQFRAAGHDIRIISQIEFKEIVNQFIRY